MAKVQHTCTGCVPIDASIIDVYVTLVETNKSVTNAEAGRTEAEAARVVAETQRTATFTTDHNRAVADHSIAQSDHATAGSDHTSTVAATNAANAAAAVANAKAELVQARLDTADADHTRAEGDHSKAVTDHSTASSDHTTAQSDHTTAGADHTRAETDHSTAASDHTASGTATAAATAAATLATEKAGLVQDKLDRADTDHTRAESDHTTAVSDHGIAGTDHTTATGDHTTASADHTLAGTDHATAASDHTTAGSDHTLAASDHNTASADHTQALADHEVMAGYDTRLTNAETEVSQLQQEVTADISQLEAKVDEDVNGKYNLGSWEVGSIQPETSSIPDYASTTRVRMVNQKVCSKNGEYTFSCNTGYLFLIYVANKISTATWANTRTISLEEGDIYRLAIKTDPESSFADYTQAQVDALVAASGIKMVGPSVLTPIEKNIVPKIAPLDTLSWGARLKGNANSFIACKSNIVLSQEGDSIEIKFGEIATTSLNGGGYAFTRTINQLSSTQVRGIHIANGAVGIAVRADDGTWICQPNDSIAFSSGKTFKLSYESSKMVIYVDGVSVFTYNGQKAISIMSFGNGMYSTYGYWNGYIEYIKVNGNDWDTTSKSLFGSDAIPYRKNGFLYDSQYEELTSPKFHIVPSASSVKVYFRIAGNNYGWLQIGHEVNHDDATYSDLWRIATTLNGKRCVYAAGEFTDTTDTMLNTSENEFAIQFDGMGDFTGGYHGDERIDLDANCYVVFIADGKEYTITDLVALGEFDCDSFEYRQKSMLYASYSYNPNHYALGYHIKRTVFGNGGYRTSNIFQLDLSDEGISSILCKVAYPGLVCVMNPAAAKVVGDMGDVLTFSHPTSSTVLSSSLNKTDRKAKFFNGGFSCEMDSGVEYTNVESWKNAPIAVQIYDRQYDGKYYNVLPYNITLNNGALLHFWCSVKWNYRA